jgi:AraC-like DNA-binding protein
VVVERYWSVRWSLPEGESYLSETLPFPCVNLVFEADRARINGIYTRRFARTLRGTGRVFGVRFRPGAFAPFFPRPIEELTDRVLPFTRVFGPEARALERSLTGLSKDTARVRAFEAFLEPRLPAADREREQVAAIVELAFSQPSLTRVEALARAARLPTRSLQRLFKRYLGVSPKWLLCRARIQEAAQRVAAGDSIDWAALAADLGYFDQAHLAHDFKAQLGKTPRQYAALTRAEQG